MTLGRRIAQYRRRAGFTNTQALAAFIGNPQISDAVLRNIESGRKVDVSATQLVELALALGVPLTALLAPLETPLESVDLPAVSARVQGMTAGELDARLSATGPDQRWWPASHAREFRHVTILRGLLAALRLLDNFEVRARSGTLELETIVAGQANTARVPASAEDVVFERGRLRTFVDFECERLAEFQDVAWVPRPWARSESTPDRARD